MATTTKKEAPSQEELLSIKEEELAAKEAELSAKEEALTADIKNFEDFQEETHALAEKLAKSELDLKERELALDKNAKAKKSNKPAKFTFEDEDYQWADNAPEAINFGGQKWTREDIESNEEVLLQLIGGGSTLIKKL